MEMQMNSKELNLIYSYNNSPSDSWEYAHNLGYEQGASSLNSDLFTPYLEELINNGILTKVYDFTTGDFREAIYQFEDGKQIEFIGENYMNYKLYYLY
jgi:hypothetical protein